MQNNFVFFGTPDVASETLEILKQSGFLPTLIVTAPDRPAGRKMILTPPPVKTWAIENNILYLQPEKIDEDFIGELKKVGARLFIVVAYGKILPQSLLDLPELGCINIHYSLLPLHRGASPVEASILSGDTETGVSIQQMEFKMDAGPIIAEEKTEIGKNETTPELRQRLIKIGGDLLVKILPDIFNKNTSPKAQDHTKATFCKKIKKEDGLVDLEKDNPQAMWHKYKAYKIWPRTYFFKDGKRIIITDAELIDGKFVIKKIIPEGKKEIEYTN